MNLSPVLNLTSNGNFCQNDEVTIEANIQDNYLWSTGEVTQSIIVTNSNTYSITATTSEGCEAIASIEINENTDLQIFYTIQNPLCFGNENGFIRIDSIQGGISPYLFSLNNGSLQSQNEFTDLSFGFYTLLVEDLEGCQRVLTLELVEPAFLQLDAGTDKEIRLGESTEVSLITNVPNPMIQWVPSDFLSCDSCLNTILTPNQTTDYQIIITDNQGCTNSDFLTIRVKDTNGIYTPNAFSPNNDGFNDSFTIFSDSSIELISTLKIFDRWGSLIFEAENFPPNDPTFGWNGTFEGDLIDSGVYLFFIELIKVDGDVGTLSGDVILMR